MKAIRLALILLAVVSFSTAQDCEPRQIHLSLGDAYYYASQDEYFIKNLEASNHSATLIYHTNDYCGESSVTILSTNLSSNATINATRITNFTGNYAGPYKTFIYTIYIYNLVPYVIYDYQISSNGVQSKKYSFQVPTTSKNETTKILFIGDLDMHAVGVDTWKRIREKINPNNFISYDAFIHLGDLAYNLVSEVGKRGDYFMENMSTIASWMPYTVIPGNHEHHNNFSNFNARLRMPIWENTQNHMYSMNIGLIHFNTFNFDLYGGYPDLRPGMLQWLEADLKRANQTRDKWPWVVMLNHRPLYCSNIYHKEDCGENWKTYGPVDDLLYKYQVDLWINGHAHSYERTYPIYKSQVYSWDNVAGDNDCAYIKDPKATVHVDEGIAGNVEVSWEYPFENQNYTLKSSVKPGYGELIAHNRTHLQYIHTISKDNTVFDNFYIIKSRA